MDQVLKLLQEQGSVLNYINLGLLVEAAAWLSLTPPLGSPPPPSSPPLDIAGTAPSSNGTAAVRTQDASLQLTSHPTADSVTSTQAWVSCQLASLVLQHSSWFQSEHFAQCAVGLACMGYADPLFWRAFRDACDRKMGACTFDQLATIVEAFAMVG